MLRERFTPDRARVLMFFPEPLDMAVYPRLVACPPPGAPMEHPQAGTQISFLAMLYLFHVKSWPHAKEFILAGGLDSLAATFVTENLYLRGQALDTFHQLTGHEGFDWFRDARSEEDSRLHAALRGLAASNFLDLLCQNSPSPFPGASFLCLQIMAFWLSWMRALWTGKRPLLLSRKLMDKLRAWLPPVIGAGAGPAVGSEAESEERALMDKLVEDFSRFPCAEDAAATSGEYASLASVTAEHAASPGAAPESAPSEGPGESAPAPAPAPVPATAPPPHGASGSTEPHTAGAVAEDDPLPDPPVSAPEWRDAEEVDAIAAVVLSCLLRRSEFGGVDTDIGARVFAPPPAVTLPAALSPLSGTSGPSTAAVPQGRAVEPPTAAVTATATSAALASSTSLPSGGSGGGAASRADDVLAEVAAADQAMARLKFGTGAATKGTVGGGVGWKQAPPASKAASSGPSSSSSSSTSSASGTKVHGAAGKPAAGPGGGAGGVGLSLEREWRVGGRSTAAMHSLLHAHGPLRLREKVGAGLSEELLQVIVRALDEGIASHGDTPAFAAECLQAVVALPRFGTVVMFLEDAATKASLSRLLAAVESVCDVEPLRSAFQC